MKKTIKGVGVSIVGLGVLSGGLGMPEIIEYSKEYSIEQIKEKEVNRKPEQRSKDLAEIMSNVFVAKENVLLGERRLVIKRLSVVVHEKIAVVKNNKDLLKIIVSGKKGDKEIKFKPFWYLNPPVSNKECVDSNNDDKIERVECTYDYDTDSVLKTNNLGFYGSQHPEIK